MGPTKSLTFSPGDLRVAMSYLAGGFQRFFRVYTVRFWGKNDPNLTCADVSKKK